MNKLIKGAVTGAAGIALLLGGAGTFAAWNSSTSIATGGSVNTGQLTIDSVANPQWIDVSANNNPISDISNYVFVPGDHVRLTEDVTFTAEGDNLTAQLSATLGQLDGVDSFTATASFDTSGLAAAQKANITLNADNKTYTVKTSGGKTPTTLTVPVTVDIALSSNSVNADQGKSIDLTDVTLDLKQSAPAAFSN